MPILNYEHISEHSQDLIYQLITDIERYPEFLPWCKHAEIVDKQKQELIADLSVSYKLLCETYRSKVKLSPPKKGSAHIDVTLVSGPFKKLINNWHLEEIKNNKTKIHFFIDFEFKSVLLDKLMSVMFENACKKLINAFENRADELLKMSHGSENSTTNRK